MAIREGGVEGRLSVLGMRLLRRRGSARRLKPNITTVAHLLAYVTGLVNQELLLKNEYLRAENRILKAHLQPSLRLSKR